MHKVYTRIELIVANQVLYCESTASFLISFPPSTPYPPIALHLRGFPVGSSRLPHSSFPPSTPYPPIAYFSQPATRVRVLCYHCRCQIYEAIRQPTSSHH
ncbi:hypothetical protein L2E82_50773 [Cichorium intybus]|nr:hypothetical protein L2E82_50773 [Cichorium intybus]